LSQIIKTRIPFSDEFIPPNIVCRDPDIIVLKRFVEPLTRNEPTISSVFITGGVGVGKTSLAKFVLLNIPAKINYCYIQLRESHTTFGIMSQITKAFLPDMMVTRRSTGDLTSKFLVHMKNKSALVILDEIDKIPLKYLTPILHSFSRESWISFILLSRLPNALDKLPVDTKSSLKCRNLVLKTYNKQELYEILKQRVQLALNPNTIDEDALEKIAEYASCFGNARLAIDILKEACEIAEMTADRVTVNHVNDAIVTIEESSLETAIADLPQTHNLALKAIIQISERQPAVFKKVLQLWQNKLSMASMPTFSRWKFYDVISDLKKLGMVETSKFGRGRGKGFKTVLKLSDPVKDLFKKQKK